MKGVAIKAAAGSAHRMLQIALQANPIRAMLARYAQAADCAESARNDALPVAAESTRFSRANHGIPTAAAIRIANPTQLGLTSL
jgi:hypothetical protein